MLQQAEDFLTESDDIYALVKDLTDEQREFETGFKGWTIHAILRHLHVWNHGAFLSLTDPDGFKSFAAKVMTELGAGGSLRSFESKTLDGLSGQPLVDTWHDLYRDMAPKFGAADPAQRLEWMGPSMSVRSSITARQMETWAHGQAIYDVLGIERKNADRLRNIAFLGVKTYGWTFQVNGKQPPQPVPYVRLTAPSGAIWDFGEASDEERVDGDAAEFCQVVTQCRNIADTQLTVTGPNAKQWMAIAQCFAGGPEAPPPPGTRARKA